MDILGVYLPPWLLIVCSLFLSFAITFFSIPTIVRVSGLKKLFDFPNERASHENSTPNLGGLAIFTGFIISIVLFVLSTDSLIVRYISGALVILFFTGLKDDILIIDPKKKLLSQLLAASFVVLLGDIRITGFHGILGLEDISYPLSIFVSVFLVVSLINGFNLIDGVDGLSSAIAIMGSAFFGTWFFLSGQVSWSVISFSIAGSLLAYFIFNVFGRTNKIFMGDTGSMITGLIVAIVTIKFINSEKFPLPFVSYKSVPAFAFSMLILPLFDTLRIIILRLIKGESPFKADKNHIHHNLLKLGLSHIQVTVFLVIITLTLVIPVIILKNVNSLITIGIVVLIAVVFTMLMDIAVKKTGRNIPGNS